MTKENEGSANRILDQYLIDVNTIPEITSKVYAMEKTITFKLGMKQPERNRTAKKMLMKEVYNEKAVSMDSKDEQ